MKYCFYENFVSWHETFLEKVISHWFNIIICTKLFSYCRSYAENIESQLKSMNMLVDMLFPQPHVTPVQILANLSQAGTLYAIFITTDNEAHHSLTLHILYDIIEGMTK